MRPHARLQLTPSPAVPTRTPQHLVLRVHQTCAPSPSAARACAAGAAMQPPSGSLLNPAACHPGRASTRRPPGARTRVVPRVRSHALPQLPPSPAVPTRTSWRFASRVTPRVLLRPSRRLTLRALRARPLPLRVARAAGTAASLRPRPRVSLHAPPLRVAKSVPSPPPPPTSPPPTPPQPTPMLLTPPPATPPPTPPQPTPTLLTALPATPPPTPVARAAALAAARHAIAAHAAAARRRNTAFSAPRTARGSRGWNSAAAAPSDKAASAPHAARASGARAKRGRRANQSPVKCIVEDIDIVFASVADAQSETPRELLGQADNKEDADMLQLGDNFECAAAGAAAESNDTLPPPVIATPAEPEQGEFLSSPRPSSARSPLPLSPSSSAPARHPPPCGSRSRPPRSCALANTRSRPPQPCALAAINELEQSAPATPLEPELEEPSERELETGEREPEPGELSPHADSNGDERTVLLIINKRSTAGKKPRGLPSKRHTSCYSKGISWVYLGIIDSNV